MCIRDRGKNWGCVLYPSLCFADISHGTMDTAAKEELEAVLDEEDVYKRQEEER